MQMEDKSLAERMVNAFDVWEFRTNGFSIFFFADFDIENVNEWI